eukprot:TRINITY_DN6913_c0_g1_i1.p1 TRINITY_DN6913_c0_g1~~TRINITY_DN6913_c0_g1_i1.p1  ORF type:complete len:296 (-),score=89.93 TRINITY_DN6913_c0_g1_i1:82-969(-)
MSEKKPNPLLDITAGSIGGFLQVASGHPFDTCKVRLQTQVVVPGQPPRYKGFVDCFSSILKQEGFGGLYKGVASPAMGCIAMNASMFFSYAQSRNILLGGQKRELSLSEIFLAGAMTGFAISFVEGPFDNLKCKLQAQLPGQPPKYNGVFDAAGKIMSQFGVRGVYQGLGATLVRNVPANASYFGTYEATRRALTPPGETPSMTANFIAGGMGGFGYWVAVYPLEVCKTLVQADSSVHAERKYKNIFDCFVKVMKSEGYRGFTKGFSAAMVRAFPANAFCFLGYETALKSLKPMF